LDTIPELRALKWIYHMTNSVYYLGSV
jgi:hypothetical protein